MSTCKIRAEIKALELRIAAGKLQDDVKKFEALQDKLSDFGARDTEPSGFFRYLMRKAMNGESMPEITPEHWGLYSSYHLENKLVKKGMAVAIELTDANFEQEVSSGVVLVDFWASWCGPCKMLAPTIDQLASENEGKAKIAKVDVDEYGNIAAKMNIRGIPTVILFKDGKVIDMIVGANQKNRYQEAIDKALNEKTSD